MSTRRDELLRWPLWSWRNFSVTAAAVLLLFAGLGRVAHSGPASNVPRAPAPASKGTAAPSLPAPSPAASSDTASSPSAASGRADAAVSTDPAATRVAAGFVLAWAQPGLDQRAWLGGIRPFVAPSLLKTLSSTDPAQVPASTVTGEAKLLRTTVTSEVVEVPTNGGPVAVTLHAAGGRWKVTDIEPADQPQAAPTPALTMSGSGS